MADDREQRFWSYWMCADDLYEQRCRQLGLGENMDITFIKRVHSLSMHSPSTHQLPGRSPSSHPTRKPQILSSAQHPEEYQ